MQSIGERLEEARKRKGITIREASEATKIRGDYLDSFENNTFKINLPEIYTRGFLRSYANYLKLNSDKVITDYNAHLLGEGKSSRRENREFFGRLELQPPAASEEPKHAGVVGEGVSEKNEDAAGGSIWEKLGMEKDVALKVGIALTLSLAVIIAVVWGFLSFMGSDEPIADSEINATPTAQAADTTPFTLVAKDDVRVEVKQIEGDIALHRGPLAKGQEMELSAIGSVRITFSDPAALSVRIGQVSYQMPDGKSTIRITPSSILQKQQSGN